MFCLNLVGEVRVQISETPIEIHLNDENLNKLRNFHIMVFSDILKVTKEFFVLDHHRGPNSYFIVPTKNGDIDWNTVYTFQSIIPCLTPSVVARAKMVFKPEDYIAKVVSPWFLIS